MEDSSINVKVVESLEGRILVATPSLNASYFEKTVIYIYAHDEEGALGTIINKQVATETFRDMKKKLGINKNILINKKVPIYMGGPLHEDNKYILSADREQKKNFTKEQALTLFTNSDEYLSDVIKGRLKTDYIVLKGFCGWGAGQLEAEIEENSWIVINAEYNYIFSNRKKNLWSTLIKKTGIKNFQNLVGYSGNA